MIQVPKGSWLKDSFLYCFDVMETFHQYTPYDPSSEEHKATVTMAFIDQASRDIRKRLQKLEQLKNMSLRDLVHVAEKVYHNRETEEEKE